MNRIRAFIVDDEPPARRRIAELLESAADVDLAGEFGAAGEALEAIRREKPDLLFLDVQMPGLDGFGLLAEIDASTITIFVTAHDAYALKAFEVRALDYLLKPYSDERFEAALERARERIRSRDREALGEKILSLAESHRLPPSNPYLERIVVRNAGRILFLDVRDVDWIEAAGIYSTLHEGGREHLVRESLTSLESRLDPARFARIHRSAIVALDRVTELRMDDRGSYRVILRNGAALPLSRRQREELQARLQQPHR